MSKWAELQQRLQRAVKRVGGPMKTMDGAVMVLFIREDDIQVEIGCYSIGDWPRRVYIGSFVTEEKALAALEAKIVEAEKEVEKELKGELEES